MKKLKSFITNVIPISAGASVTDLLFFNDDYWKVALSIFILAVSFKINVFVVKEEIK